MQGVHIEYFSTHDRTCVYAVDVSLHEAHAGTDASVCYQLTLDPECTLFCQPFCRSALFCRRRPTVRWILLVVLRSTTRKLTMDESR